MAEMKPLPLLIIFFVLASCASVARAVPEWADENGGVSAVFPDAVYIARKGEGETRQAAELSAVAQISFYFSTKTDATAQSRRFSSRSNGGVEREEETSVDNFVRTQTNLFAVRYAKDPWLNPRSKNWETVAYIDRDEGWQSYEKNVQNQTGAFLELVRSAETDLEPLGRALRFGAAEGVSKGDVFIDTWDFAFHLHPEKAAAAYRETSAAIKALPEKIYTARQKATVFIDCPVDYNSYLYQAAESAFGNAGFPVETRRDKAAAVCVIRVDEGFQKLDSGVLYYPSLSVNLAGKTAPLFSFNLSVPRQAAITADAGKRRAYDALAKALVEKFPAEIMNSSIIEK
ncbi:hypothetical protein FACS189479_02770 [Spirochaetia bacterium]|nr:hypothetical protein FACS189479_02770 [Spirochaetia bacterium]